MEDQKQPPPEQPLDFADEEVTGAESIEPQEPVGAPPDKEKPERAVPIVDLARVPDAVPGGAPPWVRLPAGLRIPRGRKAVFVRIPSRDTDAPNVGLPLPYEDEKALLHVGRGDPEKGRGALWRQCILWPLDAGDNTHALQRAMGDPNRLSDELTRQMIRCIDGNRADWTGAAGESSMDQFWNQIGQRNRQMLQRVWSQLHVYARSEQVSFFENCVAVRVPTV